MLSLYGMGQVARAGSQFAVAEEGPVRAATRLDFTIIIPQIMTLQIGDTDAANAAASRRALKVPAIGTETEPSQPGDASGHPVAAFEARAFTNAGTLAIGQAAPFPQSPGVSLDTHSATFLVALP